MKKAEQELFDRLVADYLSPRGRLTTDQLMVAMEYLGDRKSSQTVQASQQKR